MGSVPLVCGVSVRGRPGEVFVHGSEQSKNALVFSDRPESSQPYRPDGEKIPLGWVTLSGLMLDQLKLPDER